MPIEIFESSCKYCQSAQLRPFLAEERMLGLGKEFTYLECESCGSLQIASVPSNLGDYYPKGYYSFQHLRKSDTLRKFLKKVRMQVFLQFGFSSPIYGYWLKRLKPKFQDRIADVGCGSGQLLYELHAGGFRNLEGYDPFIEKSQQVESGLKLYQTSLENSQGSFEVIMMHHAFEHLEDPKEALIGCFEKLNPGGKLLVRCPVADAQVWKDHREMWVQLDAPRHLTIPTVEGFSTLAKKVGFKVSEVLFDSDAFQFWGTGLYEKGEKLDQSKISTYYSTDEYLEMQKKALHYNQEGKGDQACFFLQKPIKA